MSVWEWDIITTHRFPFLVFFNDLNPIIEQVFFFVNCKDFLKPSLQLRIIEVPLTVGIQNLGFVYPVLNS